MPDSAQPDLPRPDFPGYDPALAELAGGYREPTGLSAFLGIEVREVGPGTMSCALEARDDLLNPFGTLHGGVISALVDHVLGAVCYPVIATGAWAATTEFKLNLLAPVREGTVGGAGRDRVHVTEHGRGAHRRHQRRPGGGAGPGHGHHQGPPHLSSHT